MLFSLQDVTFTLNGHTVEGEHIISGWSEDSRTPSHCRTHSSSPAFGAARPERWRHSAQETRAAR